MRYWLGSSAHRHEIANGLSMLPGIAMAFCWPVHGSCVFVPYAYSMACFASILYHLSNCLVGYNHVGFIMDVVSQMLCCALIAHNNWAGHAGSMFILGSAFATLGCNRRHAIFVTGICIIITSGPYFSSILWAFAFALYLVGKTHRFRWFHTLFHLVGQAAVHCTVANMSCYG